MNHRKIAFSALFAALTSSCAFLSLPIPVSPVPIVFQNMMAVLSGQILGSLYGGLSVLIFLLAGALGLPVFSGGGGGIARFASATGGFLIGYFFAAILAGLPFGRFFGAHSKSNSHRNPSFLACVVSSSCGFIAIYVPGIMHYVRIFDVTVRQALAVCFFPFAIPDLIKLVLSAIITFRTKPAIDAVFAAKEGA